MRDVEGYPGLVFIEDDEGVDEQRFGIVAPAIAEAIHWALTREDDADIDAEWVAECLDTTFSYAAQLGDALEENSVSGPQLDRIYDYAVSE